MSWLLTRGKYAQTVALSVLVVLVAIMAPILVWTPQSRGPSVLADSILFGIVCCAGLAGGLGSRMDAISQIRSPRPVNSIRVALTVSTIALVGAFLEVGNALGGSRAIGATIQSYIFLAGVVLVLSTSVHYVAGMLGVVAYVGACLFVGVASDGAVAWWAVLLLTDVNWQTWGAAVVGLVLTLVSAASTKPAGR